MATVIKKRTNDDYLFDKTLSFKAKGLMAFLMRTDETFNCSLASIAENANDKTGAIRSAIKELENKGYLEFKAYMPSETGTGRFRYEYIIK